MAQVDAPQEGDVELGPVLVAQDHELLVVRAPGPYPHVQEALAARVIDVVSQFAVLRRREGQPVLVGAPEEAADVDTAPGRRSEHGSDFGARAAVEALVGVASPVSEHQQVAVAHLRDPAVQLLEVRRAMDQGTHQIALGPRHVAGMAAVKMGRGVAAFARGHEPLCRRQRRSLPAMPVLKGLIRARPASPGGQCLSVLSRLHHHMVAIVLQPYIFYCTRLCRVCKYSKLKSRTSWIYYTW